MRVGSARGPVALAACDRRQAGGGGEARRKDVRGFSGGGPPANPPPPPPSAATHRECSHEGREVGVSTGDVGHGLAGGRGLHRAAVEGRVSIKGDPAAAGGTPLLAPPSPPPTAPPECTLTGEGGAVDAGDSAGEGEGDCRAQQEE